MVTALNVKSYYYTTDVNKKYIAVITYQDTTALMKLPCGSKIAISLPANRTVSFRWSLSDRNYANSIMQLYDYSWIKIQRNVIDIVKEGENYDRENFYFNALDEGDINFIMRYESLSNKSIENNDYFEIKFKITIIK